MASTSASFDRGHVLAVRRGVSVGVGNKRYRRLACRGIEPCTQKLGFIRRTGGRRTLASST